jgi:8-oxo-dGTP diphosphatase
MMKNVVAAYIEINDKFLIGKRAEGKYKGLWEFPGGKVESCESDEAATEREIKEELNLNVKAHELIASSYYPAEDKTILLKLYRCDYLGGDMRLMAHSEAKFITKNEINDYEWCPADYDLLNYIKKDNSPKKRLLTPNSK